MLHGIIHSIGNTIDVDVLGNNLDIRVLDIRVLDIRVLDIRVLDIRVNECSSHGKANDIIKRRYWYDQKANTMRRLKVVSASQSLFIHCLNSLTHSPVDQ